MPPNGNPLGVCGECKQESARSGAAFSVLQGEPKATGESGTLLVVNVSVYRFINAGMRMPWA